jgi:hypothetical protein
MESYEKKSDDADSNAERLAGEGERVEKKIEDTKRDWEAKQSDSSVPGAVPDEGDEEERPAEAQSERGEAPDSAGQ